MWSSGVARVVCSREQRLWRGRHVFLQQVPRDLLSGEPEEAPDLTGLYRAQANDGGTE